MAEEVSKAIDRFLSYTGVQSHHYGVPNFTGVRLKTGVSDSREIEYTKNYSELVNSLDEISYLHELNQLKSSTLADIDKEYDQIVQEMPLKDIDDIIKYLKNQVYLKTNSIQADYLQTIVPILKAIHHKGSDITSTELNISRNLSLLFDKKNENLNTNVHKLIKEYNKSNEKDKVVVEETVQVHQLLEGLEPKLQQLNKLTVESDSMRLETQTLKAQVLKEAELDEKALKDQFFKMVENWYLIIAFANFLPNYIMTLHVNWYENKTYFSIIQQCAEITAKFEKYLRVINRETLESMTVQELLLVDI